jgi:hypothetical protein
MVYVIYVMKALGSSVGLGVRLVLLVYVEVLILLEGRVKGEQHVKGLHL